MNISKNKRIFVERHPSRVPLNARKFDAHKGRRYSVAQMF
jgi:hypothetical protein